MKAQAWQAQLTAGDCEMRRVPYGRGCKLLSVVPRLAPVIARTLDDTNRSR